MRRAAGERIDLPRGWWSRFQLQFRGIGQTFKAFCDAKPTISQRTLARARASGWVSPSTLATLAIKLGVSPEKLLTEWSEHPAEEKGLTKLRTDESIAAEDHFVALVSASLYDEAVAFAEETLARAEVTGDDGMIGYWADRTADAYRTMGALRDASRLYARAWEHIQLAQQESPSNVQLRYQAGKTRFGQIMVDCMMRGSFREALLRYGELLRDAEHLMLDDAAAAIRSEIRIRMLHVRRQQAEMLRLLGRYAKSLAAIREVAAEYPAGAYEARAYASLSEADSLRLLGDVDGALEIYSRIEQLARERHARGMLASTLWRMSCALKLTRDRKESEKRFREASAIAEKYPQRYRFLVIYCRLAEASGEIRDRRRSLSLLDDAARLGNVTNDYLVLEYAHIALCRAELLRGDSQKRAESLGWFRVALSAYDRMECRWGAARAWVGSRLTGGTDKRPPSISDSLEGTDEQLISEFEDAGMIQQGFLSANIP